MFATLPTYLKVKEAKKRTIEFILGLDSLNNEKLKQKCRDDENIIKREWKELYFDIQKKLREVGYR